MSTPEVNTFKLPENKELWDKAKEDYKDNLPELFNQQMYITACDTLGILAVESEE